VKIGSEVKVSVEIENTGAMAGEEVAQLYIKGSGGPLDPVHSLVGFQRVTLKPLERKTVQFTLKPEQTARFGPDGHRSIEPGSLEIAVGGAQPDARRPKSGVEGTIRLTGPSKRLD
jgi:beta-glucosidase